MRGSTLAAIRILFAGDPIRGEKERAAVRSVLGLQPEPPRKKSVDLPDRIVSMKEAAHIMNCTVRSIHLFCKQGLLRRVILPGRKTSRGVLWTDLEALINTGLTGRTGTTEDE